MPSKNPTPEQREAQRARVRKHYQENKQYYIDKASKRNKEARQKYNEYKESLPCTDCGVYFPCYVTHFDHIGDDKKFNIADRVTHGWKQLKEEMDKCELVCANCHAIRTHKRLVGEEI